MYSVVLTNLHHVNKYQAEGFTVGGGVIAFIQIHMANKTNEVRKFCLDFDLRRFDTILIDPETVTEVLKMLAVCRGQHFQGRGHSFLPYGPTLSR